MVTTQIEPAAELQRAAELLFKNWLLAIPTALVSLAIALFGVFVLASVIGSAALGGLAGGRMGATLAALAAAAPLLLAFCVVAAVLIVLAQAVVVRAAEDVWEGHPVDLSASLGAVSGRVGSLVGALVLVILILIIPLALSFVLIGIPLVLLAGYFVMYTVPAVVLGGESPTGAVAASFRIAKEHVGPSIVAFVGIVVAFLAGAIINALFSHLALLSVIVQFAVGGLTSAYGALVAARFYMLLRPATPAT
jgi:hypothetical protein